MLQLEKKSHKVELKVRESRKGLQRKSFPIKKSHKVKLTKSNTEFFKSHQLTNHILNLTKFNITPNYFIYIFLYI